MKTLGVDLSADPAKTGACEIDWTAQTVTFLTRPTGDEALVAAASDVDMVAVDVPLGWPDPFVDALIAHRDGAAWPVAELEPPADRVPLKYRRTDLTLQASGARPLSVSSDRIGVAAMRGARIQQLLIRNGMPVDRSGMTGKIVETYPAATLRIWGLPSSKYKGRVNTQACADLATALAARCGSLGPTASEALDGCDDDALDAFVCAVVARAALNGQTAAPEGGDIPISRREGWIHLPTAGVEDVTRAP